MEGSRFLSLAGREALRTAARHLEAAIAAPPPAHPRAAGRRPTSAELEIQMQSPGELRVTASLHGSRGDHLSSNIPIGMTEDGLVASALNAASIAAAPVSVEAPLLRSWKLLVYPGVAVVNKPDPTVIACAPDAAPVWLKETLNPADRRWITDIAARAIDEIAEGGCFLLAPGEAGWPSAHRRMQARAIVGDADISARVRDAMNGVLDRARDLLLLRRNGCAVIVVAECGLAAACDGISPLDWQHSSSILAVLPPEHLARSGGLIASCNGLTS